MHQEKVYKCLAFYRNVLCSVVQVIFIREGNSFIIHGKDTAVCNGSAAGVSCKIFYSVSFSIKSFLHRQECVNCHIIILQRSPLILWS